jgi:hypothetical protein
MLACHWIDLYFVYEADNGTPTSLSVHAKADILVDIE